MIKTEKIFDLMKLSSIWRGRKYKHKQLYTILSDRQKCYGEKVKRMKEIENEKDQYFTLGSQAVLHKELIFEEAE